MQYYFNAQGTIRLHSPFLFQFYLEVLEKPRTKGKYSKKLIEQIRSKNTFLENVSIGAKSRTDIKNKNKASNLQQLISVRPKYGKVLTYLSEYVNAEYVLELGSGLGVSAAYLAEAEGVSRIVSVDGNEQFVAFNQFNFKELEIPKVSFTKGLIEDKLAEGFEELPRVDLIFVDGNHTKEGTLANFVLLKQYLHDNTVVVFDDIYWSKGMQEAWDIIRKDETFSISVDLFQFGILFRRKEHKEKEHFTLWY